MAFNRLHGIDVFEVSPTEILDLFPLAKVDDILTGFYTASDGRINPVDVTMALAKGARMRGVKIIQNTTVKGVLSHRGTVTGIQTRQ